MTRNTDTKVVRVCQVLLL